MRTIRGVGAVGMALGGVLGVAFLACSGGSDPSTTGNGGDGAVGPDGTAGDGGTTTTDGGSLGTEANVCTNPTKLIIDGKDTGFVRCDEGYMHHAAHADCPSHVPRAGSSCGPGKDAGVGFECGIDSDCTAKPNGLCRASAGGALNCTCAYGCVKDSDCAAGQICECGEPVGFCVTAQCADDGACAPPSFCASAASGFGGCATASNMYVCQSAADKCRGAKDCATDAGSGPNNGVCGYSPDAGARVCGSGPLACPGRPFLVDDRARVADLENREDWIEGALGKQMPNSMLADHWARTAQMEHASIAAFARFTIELLALGAPAWAILETQAAMADETAHAQLAFALASAYAGRPIGPAPLAIDGALGSVVNERTVFATLVREGCIGETIAAVLATEELDETSDPAARAVLERIATDETRHAALAWRVARWLFERSDDAFRVWATHEIARAAQERAALDPESALVRASLRDIVEPCAAAFVVRAIAA